MQGGLSAGRRFPAERAAGCGQCSPGRPCLPSPPRWSGWNAALRRLLLLQAPYPRRAAAAEGAAGAQAAQGLAQTTQVCYGNASCCGDISADRLPRLLLSPHQPGRALFYSLGLWPDPFLLVSLSLSLSPVSATSTGEPLS